MIDSTKPDIIIATETWLDSSISSREVLPSNYTVFRRDRKRGGGGVLIAVDENLQCQEVPELSVPDCELIWIKVKAKGRRNLLVAAYYRPHVGDEESLKSFFTSAHRAATTNAYLIIGGDFNFPAFDWTTKRLKSTTCYPTLHYSFLDSLGDLGLEQLVTFPTRKDNTLDLFLTNHPTLVPRIEDLPGLSDHEAAVYMEFQLHPTRVRQIRRPVPMYSKADWPALRSSSSQLSDTILSSFDDSSDTEAIWVTLKDGLTSIVKEHVPHTTTRAKDNKPWVDYATLKLIRKRDLLYKRWKKSGREDLRAEVKDLKAQVQRRLRKAYWTYIERLIEEDDGNTSTKKKFWSYVKAKRTETAGVAPLKVDGKLVTGAKERAEALNQQFQSAFSKKSTRTAEDFQARTTLSTDREGPKCDSITVSEAGVRKLLKELDPGKAPGPDGISPRLLRDLADELAPAFTLLYQSSISTGIVPQDWRTAHVTPIYKKGERYRAENYRPISLTSVPCKMLEHIVVSAIMNFAEDNNIICQEQHGFRKRRSCESQLIGFVDEVTEELENGKQTDVLVMDFSKAFDKVSHSLLIHKLSHYGITGQVNQWIKNFLSDRRQSVLVEGASSTYVSVESGVPQGSVLGPSLFLLYINDLPCNLNSTARLFADDTLCHNTVSSPDDQQALQRDLDSLARWEKTWMMAFHPDKCQSLQMTRKRTTLVNQYQLHGHTLSNTEEIKYLGVTITKDLRWDPHVNNVVNKANKTLGFLRRTLKIRSVATKEQAYKALVRPILEYASSVWDPYTAKNIGRLEKVQRRAARWVVNRHRQTSSVGDMYDQLKWSPLTERRKKARLMTLFKFHHGDLVISSTKKPVPCRPTRTTRSSHNEAYQLPACRTLYRQKSFFPRTIAEWNALPPVAVTSATVEAFKTQI